MVGILLTALIGALCSYAASETCPPPNRLRFQCVEALSAVGFDVPDDFPLEQLELVHARVSDGGIYAANLPLWHHWAGGCNATMYRFIAADDANREWLATYTDRPSIEQHIRQDILLFEFFATALSSLECLAYGLAAIGEHLRPDVFPVTTKPWTINFNSVPRMFAQAFPNEPLTKALTGINDSAEMTSLRDTRNILAHRAAPARTYSETLATSSGGDAATVGPTAWLGDVLNEDTTRRPRGWIADALARMLNEAVSFTAAHL